MKNKFIKTVLSLMVVLFITSCKNNEKTETVPEAPKEHKGLIVSMNLIVQEDDLFQIFYTEDGSDNFVGEKCINVNVKGSNQAQEINFNIPEDVFPRQLRFDVGSNKAQKDIKVESFKLKYFDKVFEVPGKDFWYYFGNNTSIKYSKENATATPLPDNPAGYDPIFGGTSNMTKELDKLMK